MSNLLKSVSCVAAVLLVGLLVMGVWTETAQAGPLDQEIFTCIGFLASLSITDTQQQYAVVYVHNFGTTTAHYKVRFADFDNNTLSLQSGKNAPGETHLFSFGSVQVPPAGQSPTSTFAIAKVLSDSKDVMVDAESVYGEDLGPLITIDPLIHTLHRRHVGCERTPQFLILQPAPRQP